jgi:hypothetical protein
MGYAFNSMFKYGGNMNLQIVFFKQCTKIAGERSF